MTFLKKLVCVLSASAFLSCSCIPASAAELKSESDSASVDVTAKYSAVTVTDVYSVDIEWGSMTFEYTDGGRVWNPETHKYDTTAEPSWRCADGANKVKVTNHSNNPVTVEISYTPSADYSEISGEFDFPTKTLEAAAENSAPESAPYFTSSLSLSGALSQNVTSSTVIGSAKVTLKSGTDNGGNDDETQAQGLIKITSSMTAYASYLYEAPITYQGNNTYTAELYAEKVLEANENPKCEIFINDTPFYIFVEGVGAALTTETSVPISTSWYEEEDAPKRKAIIIEANKRYRLTITLNTDGKTGTAELAEIGS